MTRTELKSIEARNHLLLLGCVVLLLPGVRAGTGREREGRAPLDQPGVSNFQAVEVVKVFFIVWLASYLVRFRDEVNATWAAMLKPLGVVVLLVALLLTRHPDFGSSTSLFAAITFDIAGGGVNICARPTRFGDLPSSTA